MPFATWLIFDIGVARVVFAYKELFTVLSIFLLWRNSIHTRMTKVVKMTTLIAFMYQHYKAYFCFSLSFLVILLLIKFGDILVIIIKLHKTHLSVDVYVLTEQKIVIKWYFETTLKGQIKTFNIAKSVYKNISKSFFCYLTL